MTIDYPAGDPDDDDPEWWRSHHNELDLETDDEAAVTRPGRCRKNMIWRPIFMAG